MIYLVSSGSYSDYSIVAVFSSREKAEAYIALAEERAFATLTGDAWRSSSADYAVEEYPLDAPPQLTMGSYGARCHIGGPWNGSVHSGWHPDVMPSAPPTVARNKYDKSIRVEGFGETREHARRSMEEMRRAIVAGTYIVPPAE